MEKMEKFVIYPEDDRDSAPFWKYVKEHNAHLQKCEKCGRFRFPPMPSCPYCGAFSGKWTPVSGRGKVYTWIVVHHPVDPRLAAEVPFVVGFVELEEGPRLCTRIVGCDPWQIKGDMPVKARYDRIDSELTLLNYEPAAP